MQTEHQRDHHFLHGWHSVPGGVKPSVLAQHGHTVINPDLDDDFDAADRTAEDRPSSEVYQFAANLPDEDGTIVTTRSDDGWLDYNETKKPRCLWQRGFVESEDVGQHENHRRSDRALPDVAERQGGIKAALQRSSGDHWRQLAGLFSISFDERTRLKSV